MKSEKVIQRQTCRDLARDFLNGAVGLAEKDLRVQANGLVSVARHCLVRSGDVGEDDQSDLYALLALASRQPLASADKMKLILPTYQALMGPRQAHDCAAHAVMSMEDNVEAPIRRSFERTRKSFWLSQFKDEGDPRLSSHDVASAIMEIMRLLRNAGEEP